MSSTGDVSKDFFPVQVRVSKVHSPVLFEHIAQKTSSGESAAVIMRGLAEEALILRNHPLISILKALESKGDFLKSFHTTAIPGTEGSKEPVHTSTAPVKPPERVVRHAQTAPQTLGGAKAMAAALVERL